MTAVKLPRASGDVDYLRGRGVGSTGGGCRVPREEGARSHTQPNWLRMVPRYLGRVARVRLGAKRASPPYEATTAELNGSVTSSRAFPVRGSTATWASTRCRYMNETEPWGRPPRRERTVACSNTVWNRRCRGPDRRTDRPIVPAARCRALGESGGTPHTREVGGSKPPVSIDERSAPALIRARLPGTAARAALREQCYPVVASVL